MANYKIPQDVEAEDKLLGPFTFKQFIFLLIAGFGIFMGWLFSRINIWLILIPLPFVLVFGFLGIYRREDQPVETYLLAALNYLFKPRKRTWNPEGVVENVRLIAPKKVAPPQLKHLEAEERGQLERLGHIMDTRGWSVKRPELNDAVAGQNLSYDDRLVIPTDPAESQEPLDVHLSDDKFDPVNYPDAQKYQDLAETTTQSARKTAIAKMKAAFGKSANSKQQIANRGKEEGIKSTPDSELQNPNSSLPKVKFQPYPEGAKQTQIDPKSGKLQSKTAQKWQNNKREAESVKGADDKTPPPNPEPSKSAPHLGLAHNDELSVHHVAQQAKRIKERGELEAGQEIDLPNRGEATA